MNWWPLRYQRSALPTELHGRNGGDAWTRTREPRGSGFTVRRSCRCATSPFPFSSTCRKICPFFFAPPPSSRKDTTPLAKTCQRLTPTRAYPYHETCTTAGCYSCFVMKFRPMPQFCPKDFASSCNCRHTANKEGRRAEGVPDDLLLSFLTGACLATREVRKERVTSLFVIYL